MLLIVLLVCVCIGGTDIIATRMLYSFFFSSFLLLHFPTKI